MTTFYILITHPDFQRYHSHKQGGIKSATSANATDDATKNNIAREKRLAQFLKWQVIYIST